MTALITRDRALKNLSTASPSVDELTLVDDLILAVGSAIERQCQRCFTPTIFDELYPGTSRPEILLKNYPVLRVDHVACRPTPVLRIRNTAASNDRATGAVTSDSLILRHVEAGVASEHSLTFAVYPTLDLLATAINTLGYGWSASLVSVGDAGRASSDLRALQGSFFCKDVDADLRIHGTDLSNFEVDSERGVLLVPHSGWVDGDGSVWNGGRQYWRVVYQAGFDACPPDVQEACAEWVAALFWQSRRDPGVSRSLVFNDRDVSFLGDVPASVVSLLKPYRTLRC